MTTAAVKTLDAIITVLIQIAKPFYYNFSNARRISDPSTNRPPLKLVTHPNFIFWDLLLSNIVALFIT